MNIAERIISKCGGPQAVAEILGVDVSRVHRWKYPKERGGTGGLIPVRHHHALLSASRRRGFGLLPEDFFDQSSAA